MIIPHTIDPARVDITPAALVERLRQAECQLGGDGYLCACAFYQIWCDLSLLAEASHQPLALRRQIRCAMNHAQLNVMSIACGQNASSTPASYPPLTLKLQGQMAPWLDLLTRILSTPCRNAMAMTWGIPKCAWPMPAASPVSTLTGIPW
ncbi:hypothetical protein SODG_006348 [Sodalis praecaptivus]